MIKLVVFDWNGTLIADTSACMAADNHVLKSFGGKPVDLKTYRATVNIPAIDFYTLHGCKRDELEKNYEQLGQTFHTFYEPRARGCRTRRGTRQILKWLKSESIKIIVLSNHTVRGIESQLQRLHIKDYFDFIAANTAMSSSMKNRNKLGKLKKYLSDNRIDHSKVIIIGDSPEEIEIGKSLGIKSCAITEGYYSTDRLKSARPDYIINKLSDFKNIILSLEG